MRANLESTWYNVGNIKGQTVIFCDKPGCDYCQPTYIAIPDYCPQCAARRNQTKQQPPKQFSLWGKS